MATTKNITVCQLIADLRARALTSGPDAPVRVRIMRRDVTITSVKANAAGTVLIIAAANWSAPQRGDSL